MRFIPSFCNWSRSRHSSCFWPYYITQGGEKSPDYTYPETAELTIRDGVLKINSDGHWTTYVMTNSGEIVLSGSSLLCYFKRSE